MLTDRGASHRPSALGPCPLSRLRPLFRGGQEGRLRSPARPLSRRCLGGSPRRSRASQRTHPSPSLVPRWGCRSAGGTRSAAAALAHISAATPQLAQLGPRELSNPASSRLGAHSPPRAPAQSPARRRRSLRSLADTRPCSPFHRQKRQSRVVKASSFPVLCSQYPNSSQTWHVIDTFVERMNDALSARPGMQSVFSTRAMISIIINYY